MPVSQSQINEYYQHVVNHLKEVEGYTATVQQPYRTMGIMAAVKYILNRLQHPDLLGDKSPIDPRTFDWDIFEELKDFDKIDDFISYLDQQGTLPHNYDAKAKAILQDLHSEIEEADVKIATADRDELVMMQKMIRKQQDTMEKLNLQITELTREKTELAKASMLAVSKATATTATSTPPPKPSMPPTSQSYNRTITVRFLVDCAKYHSSIDGREYGPYTAGQTAVIYEYDADILTRRGITSAVTSTVENINALWNNLKDAILTGDDEQISLDTKKLKARNIQTKT